MQLLAMIMRSQKELKAEYSEYIASHAAIKTIVSSFMTAALLEKPENVFQFARAHFAGRQSEYTPQESSTFPFVLVGPSGVGKRTLMERLQM